MTTVRPALPIREKQHQTQWWIRPFQMLQTNLREIDADLDVERTLDYIQQHGANTWLVNAGGILAFHPSDLSFQTRNPFLDGRASGDLLGDAVQAAHARGVRVLGRMDFSKVYPRIADDHPDWCYRSPSGQRQVYQGLVSVCPSAPYYQERSFDVLTEVLTRYPLDGFFFNWFGYNEVDYGRTYHGVCHCDSCAAAFALATDGLVLPDGPDSAGYDEWKVFAARTVEELTGRMRVHIAQHRPDAALILGRNSDIIFHEANNAVGRELWHHATAEAVSAAKSAAPEVPVLVNSVAFVDMPYRMAAEEPHHYAHYFIQAIARGANPSTYIMGPPGAIEYDNLPAAAEITRFHAKWSAVYDGMRPAARVGCVRPDRLSQPAVAHERAVAEFRGFHAALQELHVPFDVVPAESIMHMATQGELSRYEALILPDVGPLGGETATALDTFVERGGVLLATGSSGLAADTVQLRCLPSNAVRAVHDGFEENKSSYFRGEAADLPIIGTRWDLTWKATASPHLMLLPPAPFGPPEKAYGHVPVDEPGYATNEFGEGMTVQFAWTVGCSYRDLGTTSLRRAMLTPLLSLISEAPVIGVALPEQVELIAARNGATSIVHLLNFSGARRKSFGPPIPIYGASLRIPGAGARHVRALVADADCVVRGDGGDLLVEVPRIEQFEVLLITERREEAPTNA